jgi:flagellar basal-body rod protein FlgC
MLDGISNALSGMGAASQRLNASASNVANVDSRGAFPVEGLTGRSGDAQKPYEPIRVEQSSNADGGTSTNTRYVSPPYVPVFDTTSTFANDQGLVAAPNVDLAQEMTEQQSARQAFEANARSVQSMSDLVRKLYDLDQ